MGRPGVRVLVLTGAMIVVDMMVEFDAMKVVVVALFYKRFGKRMNDGFYIPFGNDIID